MPNVTVSFAGGFTNLKANINGVLLQDIDENTLQTTTTVSTGDHTLMWSATGSGGYTVTVSGSGITSDASPVSSGLGDNGQDAGFCDFAAGAPT